MPEGTKGFLIGAGTVPVHIHLRAPLQIPCLRAPRLTSTSLSTGPACADTYPSPCPAPHQSACFYPCLVAAEGGSCSVKTGGLPWHAIDPEPCLLLVGHWSQISGGSGWGCGGEGSACPTAHHRCICPVCEKPGQRQKQHEQRPWARARRQANSGTHKDRRPKASLLPCHQLRRTCEWLNQGFF